MRRIEILADDLTVNMINEIEDKGEAYGCVFKDYEYISEIRRNGELVAKIINKTDSRHDFC